LKFFNNIDNVRYFSSASEISEKVWKELNCNKSLYFHKDYLISIEENNPEIKFAYLILLDSKKRAISFASLQIVNFFIDDIKNDLEYLIRKLKNIGRKLNLIPKKKTTKNINLWKHFC